MHICGLCDECKYAVRCVYVISSCLDRGAFSISLVPFSSLPFIYMCIFHAYIKYENNVVRLWVPSQCGCDATRTYTLNYECMLFPFFSASTWFAVVYLNFICSLMMRKSSGNETTIAWMFNNIYYMHKRKGASVSAPVYITYAIWISANRKFKMCKMCSFGCLCISLLTFFISHFISTHSHSLSHRTKIKFDRRNSIWSTKNKLRIKNEWTKMPKKRALQIFTQLFYRDSCTP